MGYLESPKGEVVIAKDWRCAFLDDCIDDARGYEYEYRID